MKLKGSFLFIIHNDNNNKSAQRLRFAA